MRHLIDFIYKWESAVCSAQENNVISDRFQKTTNWKLSQIYALLRARIHMASEWLHLTFNSSSYWCEYGTLIRPLSSTYHNKCSTLRACTASSIEADTKHACSPNQRCWTHTRLRYLWQKVNRKILNNALALGSYAYRSVGRRTCSSSRSNRCVFSSIKWTHFSFSSLPPPLPQISLQPFTPVPLCT